MGAFVRGVAALMLAMLLLAVPSFGQRAAPSGGGLAAAGAHGAIGQPFPITSGGVGGARSGAPFPMTGGWPIAAGRASAVRPGMGVAGPRGSVSSQGGFSQPNGNHDINNGRLSRRRGGHDDDKDRHDGKRHDGGFPPNFPFMGYGYPGFGYMGYPGVYDTGDMSNGYLDNYGAPPIEMPVSVPAQQTGNYYFVVDNNLLLYDAYGNLLAVTPLPDNRWPTGGREAQAALRATQGYWGARLRGIEAADWTDGKGFATFWLAPNGQEINFQLNLDCVRNVTSAYIQLSDPNLPLVAAPPIVPLYDAGVIGGRYTGTLAAGTIGSDDLIGWLSGHRIASLVQAIDQGHAVVVVHTAQHPQGELMGVISPVLLENPLA